MTTNEESGALVIRGLTHDGRVFRPSDWAERLAGALSGFRPDAPPGGGVRHLCFSPYCVPRLIDGVKCVVVDERLRELELLAWDFAVGFARDNQLQTARLSRPAAGEPALPWSPLAESSR